MDPLSSLGVAVNVLQVVDIVGKLISTASKLSRSVDGALAENRAIEASSKDLVKLMNELMSWEITNDETLKSLCQHSCDQAQKLLTTLGTAKIDSTDSKWRVFRKTVRNVLMESDINQMQTRLGQLRSQLTAHISVYLVNQTRYQHKSLQNTLDSIAEKMQNMDYKLEELGELRTLLGSEISMQHIETQKSLTVLVSTEEKQTHSRDNADDYSADEPSATEDPRGAVEEKQPLLADDPIMQPTQLSLVSHRSLVFKPTPNRFLCKSVYCACACHLGRYYRSPLFLKRFMGALTFKGVCENHPSKSSELKYWVPEWISNYNVHMWFEKGVCGTPSFGLKLQRKVPWGGEDTIIRFSFLGDTEGIKGILQNGRASLDDVEPNHGRTPLHYAVQKNHVRACQFLLQVGADRFIEDESGMSATQRAWEHIFTKRGAPEVLDAFRRMFPDVDLECWQFSPLHQAVLGVEGFSLPAQLKTDAHPGMINATDARGRTALHWAALRGDLEAVELLLDAGADVDVVDEFKCTPLLYAVSSAKPRMIELLILRKADVNFANNRGDTPLHYAARHRDDVESVKVLVQAGARVDCKNSLGNTPFAGAAITNRLSSGKYLLQNGADRYSRNKYGDTPLRETVHHNCHEFLRMLLQTGTRYDDINRSGTTILHALALEGDRETAEILKTFKMTGLDTQLRNAKGKTAMDVCQERVGAPEGFKDAFSELWASLNATS